MDGVELIIGSFYVAFCHLALFSVVFMRFGSSKGINWKIEFNTHEEFEINR